MSELQFVAGTLAWCNERRAEQRKKPLEKLPKGYRRDGSSCPCGKATGLHVTRFSYGPPDYIANPQATKLGDLPQAVVTFVAAFDAGELPQYEAKS